MKLMSFMLVVVLGLSQAASAAITFQLSPASQTIAQGSTAQFSLNLISSVLSGEQVDAVDFNAIAGAGDGTGGVFVAPTGVTGLLGTSPMDLSGPGQAFGSNFLSGGILVPSGSGVTFANYFLDTTGVAAGNYTISLSDLAANSPSVAALPVFGSVISYEIVAAVPEPTSILTAASLGLAGVFYRRRRIKGSKSTKQIAKA